jgi:hypothetical protein
MVFTTFVDFYDNLNLVLRWPPAWDTGHTLYVTGFDSSTPAGSKTKRPVIRDTLSYNRIRTNSLPALRVFAQW